MKGSAQGSVERWTAIIRLGNQCTEVQARRVLQGSEPKQRITLGYQEI